MSQKISTRQLRQHTVLPMVGNAIDDSGDSILSKIDAELAKHFEDRNIQLTDGGFISFTGTSLTMTENLNLVLNQKISGASPQVISLGSSSRTLSATGKMVYAVIDRTSGTATITDDSTTLPSAISANQEVFIIAKRIDAGDGTKRLYLRNGQSLSEGQSSRLGSSPTLVTTTDSTTTGTATTLGAIKAHSSQVVRLSNASLVSLAGIPAGVSSQQIIIENVTGNSISINNNDATATSGNRIYTGTSGNVTLPNTGTFVFTYDITNSHWMLTGGSGSGSGGGGSKNYLSAIVTSQSSTPNTGNGNFESGSTSGWSLFNTILTYTQTQTFTVTIASPAVFTSPSAHNLRVGQSIYFTTTGALPTGLVANQVYYVSAVPSTTTFKVSATLGGSDVNTSGTQSGTHSYFANPQLTTGTISSGASSIDTFNTVNSGQLSGSYSLQTAASASLTSGQGFISDPFYIDTEDQAKRLSFKFYYKVVSGSPVMSSSQANTWAVYIYDVTNSVWIQPTGVYGLGQGSGTGYATGDFQTSSNGTQYRIALVCINTLSSAMTMYWDDFQIGPQPIVYGVPVTDWVNYGPITITASTTNPTKNGTPVVDKFWGRRVGGNLEVRIEFKQSAGGSPGSGDYYLNIPPSIGTIDLNRVSGYTNTPLSSTNNPYNTVGVVSLGTSDSNEVGGVVVYDSTRVKFFGTSNSDVSSSNFFSNTWYTLGGSVSYAANFTVPIAGWSSNVQMSSDTDTRVVSAYIYNNGSGSNTTVGTTATKIIGLNTKLTDTHSSWDAANNNYKIPISGLYRITGSVYQTGVGTSGVSFMSIGIDGTIYDLGTGLNYSSGTSPVIMTGTLQIQLNAEQLIDLRAYVSAGSNTTTGQTSKTYLSIERLSGPSTIAATETIAASYYCSANQAGTTSSPFNFDTKEFDTHGAVTTGSSWTFTAPAPGIYTILQDGTFTSNPGLVSSIIYKNSGGGFVAYKTLATGNINYGISTGGTAIKLIAGDQIQIRPSTNITLTGGSLTTNGVATIFIQRTG